MKNQIKKHGEEEGRKNFITAMEKRYNKEFQRSEPEVRLFNLIKERIPKVFVRTQVFAGDKYFVDIVIDDTHCIELFGDYWHCNPKIYESTYYHSLTEKLARDIWKENKERIDFLEKIGYKVLVVWENDLNRDQDEVITKIKKFLME